MVTLPPRGSPSAISARAQVRTWSANVRHVVGCQRPETFAW